MIYQEKLNCFEQKRYSVFLDKMYFTSNDWSQNMFVYQPTKKILELIIKMNTEYVLVGNQKV